VSGLPLNGAVAVVTGAARGIGAVIARALVAEGAAVALVDRLADELERTAAELGRSPGGALPIVADITKPSEVAAMAERVRAELGPVDVLVNNAGTLSWIGPLWEADPERWLRDIQVNLCGTFLVCRAFVGDMVRRKSGYVITMVSAGGVGDPHPWATSYASSKAGLMRMTEGLAKEVEGEGIKVFALAPPAVLTDMTRFLLEDPGARTWRPGFDRFLAAGGGCPPERVARCVLELLSGRADRLSGRFIPVQESLDELETAADRIIAEDALTLRIRPKPDPA
jgi:NAD(P)-dependent dehydrogenase (short-subunit alcohol dehydrogenase family)